MLLIGHSLTAYFTAWQLIATETPFEWWSNPATPAHEGIPELALLPSSTLTLSHHGQKLWQQVAEQIPVVRTVPFADLATTPSRIAKLREEALLDALAGQNVVYEEKAPHGVHPRLVLGARVNHSAPQLVDNFAALLKGALPRAPKERFWETAEEFINQLPPHMHKVLIADDLLARQLDIQLVPKRRHALVWRLETPLAAPTAPLLLLHRMPKGHAWFMLEEQNLTLVYDGVADEHQETRSSEPDSGTVAALWAHAEQVLPFFKARKPAAPEVTVHTDWLLPDSLPYLGPWAPSLWKDALTMRGITLFIAGGAGAREAMYAPALGEKLAEMAMATEFVHMPLAPTTARQMASVPESLIFPEPKAEDAPSYLPTEPNVMQAQHTQITETPAVKRMGEVRMVNKREPIRSVAALEALKKKG